MFTRLQRRRGSIVLETALTMPLIVVMITLGMFLAQADISRQETAVYTRASAMAAAEAGTLNLAACAVDQSATGGRTEVTQETVASCSDSMAKRGLRAERPFWREMTYQAQDWREILRDVKPDGAIRDIHASGSGSVRFNRSINFFQSQGDPRNTTEFAVTRQDFWDDTARPLSYGSRCGCLGRIAQKGNLAVVP